jgi:16S rRNA pseudouridine516 synthase
MPAMRRLDQVLSALGYCSRREAEAIVRAGRVQVAGAVAKRADARVNAAEVLLDQQPLEAPEGLLAVFHKPLGYVCTHADGEGDTIYEWLPRRWLARNPPVTSVGRLDKDTSGLLLITDVGQIVQRYTSPRAQVEKVYEGQLLLRGEDRPCLPARLEIKGPCQADLTLQEGRYHQVRRMFASQGWHVEALHRSRFGTHTLEGLAPGEWRRLDSLAEAMPG